MWSGGPCHRTGVLLEGGNAAPGRGSPQWRHGERGKGIIRNSGREPSEGARGTRTSLPSDLASRTGEAVPLCFVTLPWQPQQTSRVFFPTLEAEWLSWQNIVSNVEITKMIIITWDDINVHDSLIRFQQFYSQFTDSVSHQQRKEMPAPSPTPPFFSCQPQGFLTGPSNLAPTWQVSLLTGPFTDSDQNVSINIINFDTRTFPLFPVSKF